MEQKRAKPRKKKNVVDAEVIHKGSKITDNILTSIGANDDIRSILNLPDKEKDKAIMLLAEAKLLQGLQEGHPWAIRKVIETKGTNNGYGIKSETVTHIVNHTATVMDALKSKHHGLLPAARADSKERRSS